MVAKTFSVAFQGVEARPVEVQCALSPGLPGFSIVGLPDKAVTESRDRIKSALAGLGIALPSKKITINLAPADLPKEGSHFDLPIALSILAALEIVPPETVMQAVALGEVSLDGGLVSVPGGLPAALAAMEQDRTLICPRDSGSEAAWVADAEVIAASSLGDAIKHLTGQTCLPPAQPAEAQPEPAPKDLSEVKGQERAKRALEIAAAGRHHVLLVGPPGSGKSMLAARLPQILPPLTPIEILETSMVHSVAGALKDGAVSRNRPFRAPHHTASMAAIAGGGRGAKPGEVSLAHNGVLFLDELPEFSRNVLDTLRQPLETGTVSISRANAHVNYPCRFMLVAAANPCRCGHLADASRACNRAPSCSSDYLGRISGPIMDRFDLRVDVPPVAFQDLDRPISGESSALVARRVLAAHRIQAERYSAQPMCRSNADAEGHTLDRVSASGQDAKKLLSRAAEQFSLTARGYHRVLRVARTIADLDGSETVERPHIAEALSFRLGEAGL